MVVPWIWYSIWKFWVIHVLVFLVFQVFSAVELISLAKTVNLAVWAFPSNFLYDFTLFVIDMHQNMPISLFKTLFDHFHFHSPAAIIWRVILKLRHMQWRKTNKCEQWPEVFFFAVGDDNRWTIFRSVETPITESLSHPIQVIQMQPVRLCFLLYKRDEETFKPHSGEKSNFHDQWLSLFRWRQFDKCNQWPEVFFIRCGPQWPLNNL